MRPLRASRWPQLLDGVRLFPQTLINVRLKPGDDWRANPALAARRAEVDRELGATGRVLIRPSGTEPLVRVMVEAEDAAQAKRCAERLAEALALSAPTPQRAGGSSTRSTTCTTPLLAMMSAG